MASNKTPTVQQRQRTLYRKAKQDQAVQFSRLYDKVWREDVLWEAWQQVKAHHGAPGVDGVTIEAMGDQGQEAAMIGRLAAQLRAKTYRFQPVRWVDIPKPKGGTRPGEGPPLCQAASARADSGAGVAGGMLTGRSRLSHC
jgi:RNA-directed DNA polymerase